DHRYEQGEDEAFDTEGDPAEDERGHENDGVGLEQVGGHACAVTHVVTDVVRDGRGVAWVVLGDALFDLADEVGADVGRLGEDAPAHTHEHGEKSRTEPETLEDDGGVSLVEEDDDRRAEKTEADGDHSGHASGAEGDTHGSTVGSVVTSACGGRYTDVASDRQPHADESGRCGEQCAKG